MAVPTCLTRGTKPADWRYQVLLIAGTKTGYYSQKDYYKECVSWSKISSGRLAFRYKEPGSIFNEVAPAFFSSQEMLLKLEAFLNSAVCNEIARAISPTLDFQVGQVAIYPIAAEVIDSGETLAITKTLTTLARADWDDAETSWDFRRHPLT